MEKSTQEHHIWCIYFGSYRPSEDCKICKRLHLLYPIEGQTEEQLMKKYFPHHIRGGYLV